MTNAADPDEALPEEALLQAVEILQAAAADSAGGCVAFTGSGISAESGVPVFRGNEGLWKGFRPEELANEDAFARDPERVWEWYHWRRSLVVKAEPNPAHRALAAMEAAGIITAVITQNVDGLHQRGGSKRVIELHGTLHGARCTRCEFRFPLEPTLRGVVHCPRCQAIARPDIVWFGEMLPEGPWNAAFAAVQRCSAMLVIGTSGVVYPAAGLCEMAAARGASVIIVNPEATALDSLAVVSLRGPAGRILPLLAKRIVPGQAG